MAINGKFEPLAILIAAGANVKNAAKQTNTTERTAYRITATTEFRKRVSQLRSEITSQSVGTLTQAATEAACTLRSLLDPSQEPSIRLQASKAILASLAPLSELGELRSRIDALEKASGPKIASPSAA